MKKKYISPETELITAHSKYTLLQATQWTSDDGQNWTKIDTWGDSDDETASGFTVGAKKFIWDDEDSPWNN